MSNYRKMIQDQIDKTDSLKHPPAYNTEYKIWDNRNTKILVNCVDEDIVEVYEFAGATNQIAFDDTEYYHFFIQTIEEKKIALEIIIKELKNPDTLSSEVDFIGNYTIHPLIRKVSWTLFKDHHFAQAIEEALKCVISQTKIIMKEKCNNVYDGGDSMMNHAFGGTNRDPIISFNNHYTTEEKDEQKGFMYLFKGIVGVRNRKAHENITQSDPLKTFEYLALASLLLRLLELSKEY